MSQRVMFDVARRATSFIVARRADGVQFCMLQAHPRSTLAVILGYMISNGSGSSSEPQFKGVPCQHQQTPATPTSRLLIDEAIFNDVQQTLVQRRWNDV